VVSGSKIWTSFGDVADYCEMLVRTDTDVPKHKGITWLILPMNLPGIDARVLKTMDGSGEFCEVFFDEVRVPVSNRVGDENDGWRVTNVTLSFERGTAFISELLMAVELARDLAALAKTVTRASGTAWDDHGIRRDIGKIAGELDALWALTKRNISQAQRTGLVGTGGNVFKLAYTELINRLGELAMHVLDRASLSIDDVGDMPNGRQVYGRIHALSMTIAAGTSQVQRNIVAERVLGLPREAVR
jgi:alkylation response protein AidB-like acyl-CoA dehydrogenase